MRGFLIAALTSIFLVRPTCAWSVGMRFALLAEAGLAQFVFLVLFSYVLFEGYAGLTVTLGAVATLFVLMQMNRPREWEKTRRERRRNETASSGAKVPRASDLGGSAYARWVRSSACTPELD